MANVLVLLSGGIDSAACIRFYLLQGFTANALFIEYGQASAQQESAASESIASFYDVSYQRISLSNTNRYAKGGFIRGRNAFLLFTGLLNFQYDEGIIALGIHRGTTYRDCSPVFVNEIQNVFDEYTDGRIKIGTPFISLSKSEIWSYCHKERKTYLSN